MREHHLSRRVTFGGLLRRGNNNFNDNNRRNVNLNNQPSNRFEMTLLACILVLFYFFYVIFMKCCNNLYPQLTSYENLELAFIEARKRKTLKEYVIEFEADLKQNLLDLQFELQTFTYRPRPITTFIVKDPKTRKIGASHFRDRVVHHALCNIVSPILGGSFIFDSFANRKGKGTHPAIKRFEKFLRRAYSSHQKVETVGG